MVAHIIYERYYDFEKNEIPAGGIQTYLTNLMPIFQKNGYSCVVYQAGKTNESVDLNGVVVHNITVPTASDWEKNTKKLLCEAEKVYHDKEDILIFATDVMAVENHASKSIAIQHGVCWDIPRHQEFSPRRNALYTFQKSRIAYKECKRASYVKRMICVDYNYPNWFRAVSAFEAVPLTVIPNFTEIAPVYKKPSETINIIFARRFETYRGTRVFTDSISRILDEYKNVKIMIAGRGPDEEYMKCSLKQYGESVIFTKYGAGESLKMHSDQHIAVVPTVGSEGTSLSLLEAMSAQCAVICTDVGGMTNIVLDGYNGLITRAGDSEQLFIAMKMLIEDQVMRNRLAEKAYETVKEAFSYEKWEKKWTSVIKELKSE